MRRTFLFFPIRLLLGMVLTLLLIGAITPAAHAEGLAGPVGVPPAQTSSAVAIPKYDSVNIRTGPSTNFPVVGTMQLAEACPILGRDTSTGWWLVACSSAPAGWVSYEVVSVVGDTSSVPLYSVGGGAIVAPPEPQAPAQPSTFNGWKASYFANKDLNGVPVLVQDVQNINFDWGYGSPGPSVPVDYFSARYERTVNLAAGSYLLQLRMDDGARVFVDDQLVMDDWRVGAARDLSSVVSLTAGSHRFRVEYFEDNGLASLSFNVTPYGSTPPAPPPIPGPGPAPDLSIPQEQWRAQYFSNTELAGNPIAAQYQPRSFYPLDKNWGEGSPGAGIGVDYWSARFEGSFFFSGGDFEFFVQSDDGTRVYIDNILVIDAWYDGYKQRNNTFRQVGGGYHMMRVDYYERTGTAFVRVWWSFPGSQTPISGPVPPPG